MAGADPATTMRDSAAAAVAAVDSADLTKVIPSPFGEMPVDDFLGIIWVDTLTHAWDVADAGGIDSGIDADLADAARSTLEPLAPTLREFGAIGPPVDEPAGDALAAYIAFTGRRSARA